MTSNNKLLCEFQTLVSSFNDKMGAVINFSSGASQASCSSTQPRLRLPNLASHRIQQFMNINTSVIVGSDVTSSANIVCDLGVWLNTELSMTHNLYKICSTCFYQP
jgi:hypothetical protein